MKRETIRNYTIEYNENYIMHFEIDGMVDYTIDGYLLRDSERIPCTLGYCDFFGNIELTHIFIKEGITENGTHYYSETIEIN